MEDVELFYFTPRRTNHKRKEIAGLTYQSGAWVERKFPFPDVIYNDSYPSTDKSEKLVTSLCLQIPLMCHSVGDKWTVYSKLRQAGEFSKYLIPSQIVRAPYGVFTLLNEHQEVILKPLSGHQGIGVTRISSNDLENSWEVTSKDMTRRMNREELTKFIVAKAAKVDGY